MPWACVALVLALAGCEGGGGSTQIAAGSGNDTGGALGDAADQDAGNVQDTGTAQDTGNGVTDASTFDSAYSPDAGCPANASCGVDATSTKDAQPIDNVCFGSAECAKDQYCAMTLGTCGPLGQCVAKPEICPADYSPVCGCDGKEYGNLCGAAGAGVSVAPAGTCAKASKCQVGVASSCPVGEYCTAPEGQCSGNGMCKTEVTGCTKEYFAVCGCDGKTYGNPCMAAAAGVVVSHTGECGSGGKKCAVGLTGECTVNQYCAGAPSQCSGDGNCTATPKACDALYFPVCGCDGKTYSSDCDAASHGVTVAGKGECPPPPPPPQDCTVGDKAACGDGKFCAAAGCASTGKCANKPQMCTMIFKPVCGCDGKTYGSSCSAASAGMNVAADGECAPAPDKLSWYLTCGGPVCAGTWTPTPGMPLCSTEKAGDPCSYEGKQCDPQSVCGQMLVCASSDPTLVGCPKSMAKFKSDIHYVAPAEQQRLAHQLLDTKLATYRYTAAGPAAPRHLGFIIDDQPNSPAVDPQRDMVDLYGYLSLSVATLQVQQQQIEELRQQVQALRATCGQSALMCK